VKWRDFLRDRFIVRRLTDEEKQQLEATLRDPQLPEGYERIASGEIKFEQKDGE
jgi:hypothetical protein